MKQLLFGESGGGGEIKAKNYYLSGGVNRNTTFSVSLTLEKGIHKLIGCVFWGGGSTSSITVGGNYLYSNPNANVTEVVGATFEEKDGILTIDCPTDGSYTIKGNTGTTYGVSTQLRVCFIEIE